MEDNIVLLNLQRYLKLQSKYMFEDTLATEVIKQAEREIRRLLKGDFTETEFQNLCHNLDENDEKRFIEGCSKYWDKLFPDWETRYERPCTHRRKKQS